MSILEPKHLIDVGCGIGDFVAWFRDRNVQAEGIEGTPNVLPYAITDHILIHDMRNPLPWYPKDKVDLAMSVEVAEHIDPECVDVYVGNLCTLSDNLLLTIAGPGQEGHGHVNLRPIDFWISQFWAHNYFRDLTTEAAIRTELLPYISNRWVRTICHNLIFFRRT